MSEREYVDVTMVMELENLYEEKLKYKEDSPIYRKVSWDIEEKRTEIRRECNTLDELKEQEEIDNREYVPLGVAIEAYKKGKEIICWNSQRPSVEYSKYKYVESIDNQLEFDQYEIMSGYWTIED